MLRRIWIRIRAFLDRWASRRADAQTPARSVMPGGAVQAPRPDDQGSGSGPAGQPTPAGAVAGGAPDSERQRGGEGDRTEGGQGAGAQQGSGAQHRDGGQQGGGGHATPAGQPEPAGAVHDSSGVGDRDGEATATDAAGAEVEPTDQPVQGYARAVMIAANAEGVLERVSDELYSFANTVDEHNELRERLLDEHVSAATRLEIIEDLLGSRAHPQTTAAVLWLVQARRVRQLSAIAGALADATAERRDREVAEVRTAVELDDEQRERLTKAIEKATGKHVDLKVIVDPDIMGGVVVQVGDTVIDGSVARRLTELRARMAG